MYIKKLEINHLKEVAALESQTYPEELCLGYKDYVNDFKSIPFRYNNSLGVFENGELKAYIICYKKNWKQNYYISDLVCLNPKMLLPLLLAFGECNNNYTIEAEFRYTSYRMITHIIEKCPTLIQIKEQKKVPFYYANGEDMYFIKFKIKIDEIEKLSNKKILILKEIYSDESFQVNFKNILYNLYFRYELSIKEIQKHKTFILSNIHKRNLDSLRMVGDSFRFIVYHNFVFKNEKAYSKMKEYLFEKGYTKGVASNGNIETYRNKVWIDDKYHCLYWTTVNELDTRFKNDTISYYRSYIKRKFINYYKKKKFVKEIRIYDKYGSVWLTISLKDDIYFIIPRNFSNLFDAQMKKLEFIKDIRSKANSLFPDDDVYFLLNSNGIPAIRKVAGEEVAYAYFNRVIDMAKNVENKEEIFHDWGYIISEVLAFQEYLTKGAIKHIFLNKSLNQINKMKDILTSLQIDNDKYLDKKALRKAISMAIRKDKDITPIVSKAIMEAETKWLKSKNINENIYESIFEFIERMKRYSPQINISMLFHYFGNKKTTDIVKGKYEGYFQEKDIYMDYKELGQFILEILNKRTRRNERLYSALNSIQNINEIFKGNILPKNFDDIINELKQRKINVPEELINMNRFHAKIEHKCSPEYLIAGNASVCCMSFGQEKAVTYALEKGFGIINIYYKDRVIANSVIWVNEPYNCLVLDNIEVHPNYKKFNNINRKLFAEAVKYLIDIYHLDYAVQGTGYNDLKLYKPNTEEIHFEVMKPVEVETSHFYSDAHYVYPLAFNISSEEATSRIKSVNALIRKKGTEKKNSQLNEDNIEFDFQEIVF